MINISKLKLLNSEEYKEVMDLPDNKKRRFFIAGYVDYDNEVLILFRASGDRLVAPFTMFEPVTGCLPDFNDFSIIDYGCGIKLGEYEASTRGILYDLDEEDRKYFDSIKYKTI